MASYTTLSPSEINKLVANYPIGPVLDVSIMKGGQANSSFVLTTPEGRFVLSVCDEKGFEEIGVLTGTLMHLNEHGFMTSRLVKTKAGEEYTSFDGKPVYMKEFIDGQVVDLLNVEMARQLGGALAELHEVPITDFIPSEFFYGLESLATVKQWNGEFPEWLGAKLVEFNKACNSELPSGLVHGDIFCDNLLFRDGSLTAVLDFEEVCNFYFVYDIGMCMAGCCSIKNNFSLDLAAALVAGYQVRRLLTELEKEVLQTHIQYGAGATAFWRFRQYNIIHPDIEKEKHYIPMVELAEQVDSIPPDKFREVVFGETPS